MEASSSPLSRCWAAFWTYALRRARCRPGAATHSCRSRSPFPTVRKGLRPFRCCRDCLSANNGSTVLWWAGPPRVRAIGPSRTTASRFTTARAFTTRFSPRACGGCASATVRDLRWSSPGADPGRERLRPGSRSSRTRRRNRRGETRETCFRWDLGDATIHPQRRLGHRVVK